MAKIGTEMAGRSSVFSAWALSFLTPSDEETEG
jgi:hypothetical protein